MYTHIVSLLQRKNGRTARYEKYTLFRNVQSSTGEQWSTLTLKLTHAFQTVDDDENSWNQQEQL